jgi:hypothetical protein
MSTSEWVQLLNLYNESHHSLLDIFSGAATVADVPAMTYHGLDATPPDG